MIDQEGIQKKTHPGAYQAPSKADQQQRFTNQFQAVEV
jgi:hypothetical protein